MRGIKQVWLAIIFFVCLVFSMPVQAQSEVNYLGEICFTLYQINGVPLKGQMGVLSFGAGHVALYGTFESLALGGTTLSAQGTAMVTGNTVIITLHGSTADTTSLVNPMGRVDDIYMSIDTATLGGRFVEMVTFVPQPPGGPVTFSQNGDVIFYQCP